MLLPRGGLWLRNSSESESETAPRTLAGSAGPEWGNKRRSFAPFSLFSLGRSSPFSVAAGAGGRVGVKQKESGRLPLRLPLLLPSQAPSVGGEGRALFSALRREPGKGASGRLAERGGVCAGTGRRCEEEQEKT